MQRIIRSIAAVFIAGIFALSMASACYCSPVVKEKPAMPCHQTNDECAPRYNTDHFENTVAKIQPVQIAAFDLPVTIVEFEIESADQFRFDLKPFFSSSPPIYILVRSLLI